ncbi:TRAP transporter large permease subunit [Plantactinospora sp. WMMB334]|uniref:TRAP transporter large permease subunit n=1 Tax=Plantactinospora sp. WMMB334 TaxID=3404119 RepID=UPI003B965D59
MVLALTVLLAAVALALLGLAVPVTASFIIGWVIIGPALLALGVPAPAAAMFVLYYSVLSEVTPPTALAAVGAAAITGGRTVPTMWQALKYALPAFLVPVAFVLTGPGEYLLGQGSPVEVLWRAWSAASASRRSPWRPVAGCWASDRPGESSGCSAPSPACCCSTCTRCRSGSAAGCSRSPCRRRWSAAAVRPGQGSAAATLADGGPADGGPAPDRGRRVDAALGEDAR